MARKVKSYDFDALMALTTDQKKQIIPQIAKTANSRLKQLEKIGETNWAYKRVAKDLRTPKGVAPRFSYAVTGKTDAAIDTQLADLLRFINSESSTTSGIKAINERRIAKFRENGYEIKDEDLFIDFLKSNTFRSLAEQAASEFILEDIDLAMQQGYTLDEIMTGYNEFLSRDIGLNEVKTIRRAYRRHKKRKK